MLHTVIHMTQYPEATWTQAFTDGSAEKAVRNGGAGVFIKYPDSSEDSHAFPTGKTSTNYKTESCAMLNQKEHLSTQTFYLLIANHYLKSSSQKRKIIYYERHYRQS